MEQRERSTVGESGILNKDTAAADTAGWLIHDPLEIEPDREPSGERTGRWSRLIEIAGDAGEIRVMHLEGQFISRSIEVETEAATDDALGDCPFDDVNLDPTAGVSAAGGVEAPNQEDIIDRAAFDEKAIDSGVQIERCRIAVFCIESHLQLAIHIGQTDASEIPRSRLELHGALNVVMDWIVGHRGVGGIEESVVVRSTVSCLEISTDSKFPGGQATRADDAREGRREESDLRDVAIRCVDSETSFDQRRVEIGDPEGESAGRLTFPDELEGADQDVVVLHDHSAIAGDLSASTGFRIVWNREDRELIGTQIDVDATLAATGHRESTVEFAPW